MLHEENQSSYLIATVRNFITIYPQEILLVLTWRAICRVSNYLFRTCKEIFFFFYFKALSLCCSLFRYLCRSEFTVFLLVHKGTPRQHGRQHRQSTSNFYEAWDATACRCSVWDRVTTQAHTEHLWLHVEKTWPLGDSIKASGYITVSWFCSKLGFCISCC